MLPNPQQSFAADQYAPRAQSYVTSVNHAQGAEVVAQHRAAARDFA